jgi:hypothetical protein
MPTRRTFGTGCSSGTPPDVAGAATDTAVEQSTAGAAAALTGSGIQSACIRQTSTASSTTTVQAQAWAGDGQRAAAVFGIPTTHSPAGLRTPQVLG